MYWLLVGLVRSLKSSHKEALRNFLLCEDYNALALRYLLMWSVTLKDITTHFKSLAN